MGFEEWPDSTEDDYRGYEYLVNEIAVCLRDGLEVVEDRNGGEQSLDKGMVGDGDGTGSKRQRATDGENPILHTRSH